MEKHDFFDKIDNIRSIVNSMGGEDNDEIEAAIRMLDELKDDAEQMLQDEYDEGYDLGLNRGWNHEGMDSE